MRGLLAGLLIVAPIAAVHALPEPPAEPSVVIEVSTYSEAVDYCIDHYFEASKPFQSRTYMDCINAAIRAFGGVEVYRQA